MASSVLSSIKKRVSSLGNEWDRLAPRERNLVMTLGGAIVATVLFVVGFLFFSHLSDLEEQNEEIRAALDAIDDNRVEYLEAKARMRAQEIRIGDVPPQLATDLEAFAQEVGVQIPETNPRTPTPAGRRYLEHNVDVKLRAVDLRQLGRFLKKIETSQRLIYVTRIGIRRRFAERDKLDVELTATGLERLKKPLPAKRGAGGPKPKGSRT